MGNFQSNSQSNTQSKQSTYVDPYVVSFLEALENTTPNDTSAIDDFEYTDLTQLVQKLKTSLASDILFKQDAIDKFIYDTAVGHFDTRFNFRYDEGYDDTFDNEDEFSNRLVRTAFHQPLTITQLTDTFADNPYYEFVLPFVNDAAKRALEQIEILGDFLENEDQTDNTTWDRMIDKLSAYNSQRLKLHLQFGSDHITVDHMRKIILNWLSILERRINAIEETKTRLKNLFPSVFDRSK